MLDFSAEEAHLEKSTCPTSLFHKSETPVKAEIRHLPQNTPDEDIYHGMVDLDFDVITAKQISASVV
jgi:hypothetical protein